MVTHFLWGQQSLSFIPFPVSDYEHLRVKIAKWQKDAAKTHHSGLALASLGLKSICAHFLPVVLHFPKCSSSKYLKNPTIPCKTYNVFPNNVFTISVPFTIGKTQQSWLFSPFIQHTWHYKQVPGFFILRCVHRLRNNDCSCVCILSWPN